VSLVGLLVALLIGYLIGAVPSGVIVGRMRGVDPRSSGSGRTGATNALRTLGPVLAVTVLVLDMAKGAAAVLIGAVALSALDGPAAWGAALGGVGAVAGHVRSVFIGFRGGRGAATGAGAMLVLAPFSIVAAIPVLALTAWRTRFMSLASILAAVTVSLSAVALGAAGIIGPEAVVAGALIGTMVVVAHADNIDRLLAGSERRLGSG
jgi:glycerol-3-phosphate acyltransferase PlsY